jgi:hypothetical protein
MPNDPEMEVFLPTAPIIQEFHSLCIHTFTVFGFKTWDVKKVCFVRFRDFVVFLLTRKNSPVLHVTLAIFKRKD